MQLLSSISKIKHVFYKFGGALAFGVLSRNPILTNVSVVVSLLGVHDSNGLHHAFLKSTDSPLLMLSDDWPVRETTKLPSLGHS